jgi:hypothetical protein
MAELFLLLLIMAYLAFVLNSRRGSGNGVLIALFSTAINDAAPIC